MEFVSVGSHTDYLQKHLDLFGECFPNSTLFSQAYLQWLYHDNPDGKVFGYDAYDGDVLAATYVCIPTTIVLRGEKAKALLSLNTATGVKYRGQGLFVKLAQETYARAADDGYRAVFGVANANSIGGFSRKLGFQDVAGLDARLGFGRFPRSNSLEANTAAEFRRYWDLERLRWRMANPQNALVAPTPNGDVIWIEGKTQNPLIKVQCGLEKVGGDLPAKPAINSPFSLSLGLAPKGTWRRGLSFSLPDRLKPSPLRLIYRNLVQEDDKLIPEAVLFNFVDFDAY